VTDVTPSLPVLRRYRRSWLRGDLVAGATVAAYLIPQVMAYASLAGLPPVAGLWAALPALVAYALLGSSRSLSMGPEATTALMTAVAIGPLAAGDPDRYAALTTTLALLVGVMGLAAWLLRLGFSDDVLTARSFAGHGQHIVANHELRALGVANIGSSLLRGFPVSSSASRTAIAVATGSRTQVYSLVTAASVIAVLLFLRPVRS
jgi:MFS superfamily sulfate permease-like transporter